MTEPGLADKVVLLHHTLRAAAIPHAFGGALALAYYAEPRATVDIDVNVFVKPERHARVLAVLEPLGVARGPAHATIQRDGQGRWWWGRNPIDLFFACDDIHTAMQAHARTVPFGDVEIPILAPEHLVVAKVVFDRAKDWIDLEQVLIATPDIDFDEIDTWLYHLVGRDDQRVKRFEALRQRLT